MFGIVVSSKGLYRLFILMDCRTQWFKWTSGGQLGFHRIQQRLFPESPVLSFDPILKQMCDRDRVAKCPKAKKYKKCLNCGNMDESSFALDPKNGIVFVPKCCIVVSNVSHIGW